MAERQHSYKTQSALQAWSAQECRIWRKQALHDRPETVPLIEGKILHIQDVIHQTTHLIDRMGGVIEGTKIPWNVPTAIAVAQVHDVKRFYEGFFYRKYNKTGYNHPKEGALKFIQDFYSGQFAGKYGAFLEEGVDPLVVYYAALHHGEKDYQSYESVSQGVLYPGMSSARIYDAYGWLIRDADKMANILDIDHSVVVSMREQEDAPYLSVAAAKDLFQTGVVSNGNVTTRIDGMAKMLGWWFDLNYRAAKEEWIENQVFERYLHQMNTWGLQGEQFRLVERHFQNAAAEQGFSFISKGQH